MCVFLVRQPPVGRGLLIHEVSISHTTTHHSRIGPLWTSDQLVAETSTTQNITLTTDRHLRRRWDSNTTISAGERPQTHALDRAATGICMSAAKCCLQNSTLNKEEVIRVTVLWFGRKENRGSVAGGIQYLFSVLAPKFGRRSPTASYENGNRRPFPLE